jgi:hypothetical protein
VGITARLGFEPNENLAILGQDQQNPTAGAAKASAVASSPMFDDEYLAAVLQAWPRFPEPIKAGILAMVKAAKG